MILSAIDISFIVSSPPHDGAIDAMGCDIDIDMMAKVLTNINAINYGNKHLENINYQSPICLYIVPNIDTSATI
jgi:hypothetical protein